MTRNPALDTPRGEILSIAYVHGGLAQYSAGEILGPRTLMDHELVYVSEGTVIYGWDGREVHVPSGGLLLTRPGFRETYRWDPRGRTRHAYLHFGIECLPLDWPPPSKWPVLCEAPPPVAPPLFQELLCRVHAHADWPARRPDRDTQRLLETLISLHIAHTQQGGTGMLHLSEAVHRAVHLMRRRVDEGNYAELTLESLARAAKVSRQHLCRLFDQDLGFPPLKTLRLLQCQLAVVLLARTNLSIKQVSARCGFPDALYFSRFFTRIYGESARTARKRMRSGGPPPPGVLPPELVPRVFW